jgi:hypothetical protein
LATVKYTFGRGNIIKIQSSTRSRVELYTFHSFVLTGKFRDFMKNNIPDALPNNILALLPRTKEQSEGVAVTSSQPLHQ